LETVFAAPMLRRETLPEDASWVAAAKLGETWALERMYHSYQGHVYALCHRLLGRSEDAQDAMQTAFVRAFRELPRFRGESSLKTWLYRIAVNESVGVLRKRRDPKELEEDCMRVADGSATVVEQIAVRNALARTSASHRAILVLRFWEGLSYEEIGLVLGLSLGAVKMRLHRARESFRKHYEEST
jgi:RNA polymerase sigma-70 factor, ECF subfamily